MAQALTEAPFVAGYIAAIRSSHPEIGDAPFAPETLARIIEDCAARTAQLISFFPGPVPADFPQAGYGKQFWIDRQRGGNSPPLASFPPLTASLNDDGKVVFQ